MKYYTIEEKLYFQLTEFFQKKILNGILKLFWKLFYPKRNLL